MLDTSVSVSVAEAVAAELTTAVAASTFVLDPLVRRGYIQDREDLLLENITALRVDVQVGDLRAEVLSREVIAYTCRTDIAVREKFEPSERESSTGEIKTSEIDKRVLLVEQIHEFFTRAGDGGSGRRLDDMADAVFEEIPDAFRPLYFPEQLQSNGQFTGIVSVQFRVHV